MINKKINNYSKRGIACINNCGYMRININGIRILEHRHIMEQKLGRKLNKEERVHHINHNKIDNRIENLELFESQSAHILSDHNDIWKFRFTHNESVDWTKYEVPKHNFKGICIINNCITKTRTRGLCQKHYVSYWEHFLAKK